MGLHLWKAVLIVAALISTSGVLAMVPSPAAVQSVCAACKCDGPWVYGGCSICVDIWVDPALSKCKKDGNCVWQGTPPNQTCEPNDPCSAYFKAEVTNNCSYTITITYCDGASFTLAPGQSNLNIRCGYRGDQAVGKDFKCGKNLNIEITGGGNWCGYHFRCQACDGTYPEPSPP